MKKTHAVLSILTGGFFVLIDQWCKWIARTEPQFSWYLIKPWLGWEYLRNPGIAFGLPVPNAVLLVVTPIILLLLFVWYVQKRDRGLLHLWGVVLIAFGAISNYVDRVLFEVTIDYIRVITGVINLADLLIVVGAGLLILEHHMNQKKGPDSIQ